LRWRRGVAARIVPDVDARLWVFLPTYNEVGNLEGIVRAVVDQLDRTEPENWRLLVVDDGSPDGTGELADRLAAELERVEVLHRETKDGLGKAYLAGYEYAWARGAEMVIVMDADFSHDPAYLPAMVAAAAESDLVLGSRYVRGGRIADWPPLRRLLSRAGSLYARTILGLKVNDLTSGFRCVRRAVLETIEPSTLRAQGYVFNIELTYRALLAGFTVTEVPICFRDREEGESKMSLPIALEALLLVPRLRRDTREWRTEHTDAGGRRVGWRFQRRPRPHDAGFEDPPPGSAGDGRTPTTPAHSDVGPGAT
jgi:dolichol-phosphate mannosyltransferase